VNGALAKTKLAGGFLDLHGVKLRLTEPRSEKQTLPDLTPA
jgi:hypothetical protein